MFSLDGDVAETVRGRAFKCVVVDEAALVRNLRQVWESAIRPTLADYRGDGWLLSTPRGHNDFKLFFDRGQDPEREDWASFQMETLTNPYIDPAEIEAARQELTEAAFNQEFLGLFQNWEGSVFRNIATCATAERQDGPEEAHEYVIGADWGRTTDFTVFAVVDVTARCMVALDRSNHVDYVVQRARLQALYQKWRPSKIIAEQNSIGQPIIEQLQRDGLPVVPFITTNQSKALIIEALALAFEQRSIAILSDPVLLGELQGFQAEILPSGLTRYSAPSGAHDDCVMALSIGWSALRDGRSMYSAVQTYNDATRPIGLLSRNGHNENIVAFLRAENNSVSITHFLGDQSALYCDNEFFVDSGATDAEIVDRLLNWPPFSTDHRWWPAVIVDEGEQALAAQLRAHGVWVIYAAPPEEDALRLATGLVGQRKILVHERCIRTLQAMRTRSWDEPPKDKRRADPFTVVLGSQNQLWRLAS